MHYIYLGYHKYLALKNILSSSCYIRFLVNKHRTYHRHKSTQMTYQLQPAFVSFSLLFPPYSMAF